MGEGIPDQIGFDLDSKYLSYETLSLILKELVETFGPFDPRVRIVGPRVIDGDVPYTSYPDPYEQFKIAINVPQEKHEFRKIEHLSHELVHCLRPNGLPGGRATVFEEGLAEYFKVHMLSLKFKAIWREIMSGKYLYAYDLIEDICRHESEYGMREGVKAMRAETGLPFAEINSAHLGKYFIETPNDILDKLSERFSGA